MADIIFGVMFLVGALSGYKRGVVRDVQYIVGTVIGLLAVPLFSPVIISLIERPIYRFLGSDVAGIITDKRAAVCKCKTKKIACHHPLYL